MDFKPLEALDFYKTGHVHQYPEHTEEVYNNATCRSSKHFQWKHFQGKVLFWGLQGFIKEFLIDGWNKGFFERNKEEVVAEFEEIVQGSVDPGFTADHVRALHDLGYLPLEILAFPEGTLVPIGVPLFTCRNTHKDFGWLPNKLETVTSTEIWKKITTATIAYEYKLLSSQWAEKTCFVDEVQFQNHDFSMRGLSCWKDACYTGSSHALSHMGSDTVPAISYLRKYYGAKGPVVFSVPATEHSVMCMGSKDGEEATVHRLLTQVYPKGIFSCVLDTWDFFKVLTEMLPRLKDTIVARDGKFVVRPDSGDPADVICGTGSTVIKLDEDSIRDFHLDLGDNPGLHIFEFKGKHYHVQGQDALDFIKDYGWNSYVQVNFADPKVMVDGGYCGIWTEIEYTETPESKGAIELLWDTFGGTVNKKGFKVLNPKVGLIYGDSITLEVAEDIYKRLAAKGFASCNVVLGIGSYTYQYVTRDTFGFAIKATAGVIDGKEVQLQKDPVTDDGTKKSKTGYLRVNPDFSVSEKVTLEETYGGLLQPVFLNGKLLVEQTLEEIRNRIKV